MGWARAFLFDLDGTLADSFPAIAASANHVRALRGLPALPHATVEQAVGNGLRVLMERLVPVGTTDDNAAAFTEHHPSALTAGACTPYPLVVETLRTLHARGCKMAVCSNKPLALSERVLAATGLAPLLDGVFGPESVGKPKPAPDMLLAALDRLGVPAAECLYVGDMAVDAETAAAAGVRCWTIPTGPHSAERLAAAGPERVLRRFDEVLEAAMFSAGFAAAAS